MASVESSEELADERPSFVDLHFSNNPADQASSPATENTNHHNNYHRIRNSNHGSPVDNDMLKGRSNASSVSSSSNCNLYLRLRQNNDDDGAANNDLDLNSSTKNDSGGIYLKQEEGEEADQNLVDDDSSTLYIDDEEIVTVRPSSPSVNDGRTSVSPIPYESSNNISSPYSQDERRLYDRNDQGKHNHYNQQQNHRNHQHQSSIIAPNSRSFSSKNGGGEGGRYQHNSNSYHQKYSPNETDGTKLYSDNSKHHEGSRSHHNHNTSYKRGYRPFEERDQSASSRKRFCTNVPKMKDRVNADSHVHRQMVDSEDDLLTIDTAHKIQEVTAPSASKTSTATKKVELDNEDCLFGLMVGAELKGLPYKERCVAKLKIQNILFDMQMSTLQKKRGEVPEKKQESHTV